MSEDVARRYFEALAAGDWDSVGSLWADGASVRIVGKRKLRVPDELRAFIAAARESFPDAEFTLERVSEDGELAAARWRLTGTFDGAPFEGLEPTGAKVDVAGPRGGQDSRRADRPQQRVPGVRAARRAARRARVDDRRAGARGRRRRGLAAPRWLSAAGDERVPDRGRRRGDRVRHRHQRDGRTAERRRAAPRRRQAGRARATAIRTTAAPRSRSARRCCAIPTRSPTPKATVASTTWTCAS